MTQTRQLAAIMFTDIVGYTALMGRDEQKAIELLNKNRRIQKPIIEEFNGRFIKELGDGILASFTTVSDAVNAALKIQEACALSNEYQLRIGIDHGEVVFDENDVFGDTVNIASRLQVIAPPGEIFVSESVERNIKNKKGIKSVFVKEEKLKNVKEPEKIFLITAEVPVMSKSFSPYKTEENLKFSTWKKLLATAGIIAVLTLGYWIYLGFIKKSDSVTSNGGKEKSIAVLPFKLIGNDEEGRYFAEGVADVLINHLHGIENLKVRSRTSVEKYADTKKTSPEIAKELSVDYILEGSAQKYKDDIRIIVQLINPKTDDHLWQKVYNQKFEDIFKIQSEIALNIVSELNIKLAGSDKQRIEKKPTKSIEAWDHYLRGREYHRAWWKFNEMKDINFAISFYSQAIKKDSLFALAYTWLADGIFAKEGIDLENKKAVTDSILYLIEKSIQIVPDLPDNYLLLGMFSISQNDITKGFQQLEKAIRLDPDNQTCLEHMGRAMAFQNKHLEALAFFGQAIQKETMEEYNWLLHNIGWSYLCIGEFELADTFIKNALVLQPDNLTMIHTLGHLQMLQGNYEEFQKTTLKSLSLRKDNQGLNHQGKAYLLLGDYVNAEKTYARYYSLPVEIYFYESHEKTSYAQALRKLGKEKEARKNIYEALDWINKNMTSPNYDLAKVYSFLGEKQKAIAYLKKWKPDWGVHVWVENDPLFENIKNEPAFRQLVQQFKSEIEELRRKAQEKIAKGEFPTPEMIKN